MSSGAGMRKHPRMKEPITPSPHGSAVQSPESTNSGLVTKKTIAKAASVSTRLVELWMARRLIPVVRLSLRCVRFHLPSVLAALRRLEIQEVR